MAKKTFKTNRPALEKALLVVVSIDNSPVFPGEKEELESLAISAYCQVSFCWQVHLKSINPALFLGKGKIEELSAKASEIKPDVLIFNVNLNPRQQYNIEQITGIKTVDRTQLILDIFARHARSKEGKIQVELAQLEYLLPRLKGKGIMLSRLGGGIGTRGPGEKKLEVERRRISDRISRLRKEINWIKNRREILRVKRERADLPLVSLTGYTSCGKTTLLNTLTSAGQKVSKHLFTTLDPLNRIWQLGVNQQVVLSDTVGFIHNIPAKLLKAFMSTLEEVLQADVILHIVDISRDNFEVLIEITRSILKKELNVSLDKEVLVFNKIDQANPAVIEYAKSKYPDSVFISALLNRGIEELAEKVKRFVPRYRAVDVIFSLDKKEVLNFLYKYGRVLEISVDKEYRTRVLLAEKWLSKLANFGCSVNKI